MGPQLTDEDMNKLATIDKHVGKCSAGTQQWTGWISGMRMTPSSSEPHCQGMFFRTHQKFIDFNLQKVRCFVVQSLIHSRCALNPTSHNRHDHDMSRGSHQSNVLVRVAQCWWTTRVHMVHRW